MRPSHAILVLVVLVSACAAETDAAASASSTTSSAIPAASASASASAVLEPDWAALPDLGASVIATTPLTAAWPTRFASATEDGIWLPNMNEGAAPAVARLSPDTMELTAVIDLGGEINAFPPDAQATTPSANGIWVTLAYQGAVALIDPVTNTVTRRIAVDGAPYSFVEDGDDLWIVDYENSTVLRIDIATGEELLRVEGISGPIEIAVAFDSVWVADHASQYVFRLDPATGKVIDNIWVGGLPGVAIGFGSVWARSDAGSTVSRIDPATNEVVATIPMPMNSSDLVIAGDSVWVAAQPQRGACERNSYLVRIDPASNQPDGIMDVPCTFGLATDGHSVWAGRFDGDETSILQLETTADR